MDGLAKYSKTQAGKKRNRNIKLEKTMDARPFTNLHNPTPPGGYCCLCYQRMAKNATANLDLFGEI